MPNDLTSSGIPEWQANQIAAIYQRAAARLRQIVLPGGAGGKSILSREWNAARAAQQLAQIDQLVADLNLAAADWLSDGKDGTPGPVTQAVAAGVKLADQQAKAVGYPLQSAVTRHGLTHEGRFALMGLSAPLAPPAGGGGGRMKASFGLIDRSTVALFAREIHADLSKAANAMGDGGKKVLRTLAANRISGAEVNRMLAGGVIEGQPAHTIASLRKALRTVYGEKVSILDKNGDPIEFTPAYYAKLVVHTQTRDAQTHARHDRLQDLGMDLVAVIGRVSKNFCTAFLGQVFSLSGKSSKYPAYSGLPGGGPPFHPQCSKSTRPFVDELASASQLKDADGVDDADSLLNKTPAEAQKLFKDLQIHQQVADRYKKSTGLVLVKQKA